MTGDVVAKGSGHKDWNHMDTYLERFHTAAIPVYALLGNHDLMFHTGKAKNNFQQRFPVHVATGYRVITDSMAVIMLNSNFKKMKPEEITAQQEWYQHTLDSLDANANILGIIVCCHHSPYTNSKVTGPDKRVQALFVPGYTRSRKGCLFISGHAHASEYFRKEDKPFFVTGGGGGLRQRMYTDNPSLEKGYQPMFHYLTVSRRGNKLDIRSHYLKDDFNDIATRDIIRVSLKQN